jgi:hypothetical protein
VVVLWIFFLYIKITAGFCVFGPKKERKTIKEPPGSSYFKHLKEPPGFMKELAANQSYSEQLFDLLKIDNHGHIQNWVFDFLITMIIGRNWVFEFLIIMIIGWNWVFDFFENQNNQSLRIILIPSAGLLQFLIPTQHWFLHGFTFKAKKFLKFQYVGC